MRYAGNTKGTDREIAASPYARKNKTSSRYFALMVFYFVSSSATVSNESPGFHGNRGTHLDLPLKEKFHHALRVRARHTEKKGGAISSRDF